MVSRCGRNRFNIAIYTPEGLRREDPRPGSRNGLALPKYSKPAQNYNFSSTGLQDSSARTRQSRRAHTGSHMGNIITGARAGTLVGKCNAQRGMHEGCLHGADVSPPVLINKWMIPHDWRWWMTRMIAPCSHALLLPLLVPCLCLLLAIKFNCFSPKWEPPLNWSPPFAKKENFSWGLHFGSGV